MNDQITAHIATATHTLFAVQPTVELSRPDARFGDVASNVAMQLASTLQRPPRDIAEQLAEALRQQPLFAEVTIAGPGFINIRLADGFIAEQLEQPVTVPNIYAGKKVVAEYSDPNPFKALHAGHLYTTLVGDVIARLHEVAGATVHRINFGGDVGLHVARAMWGIMQTIGGEQPEKLAAIPVDERANWISNCYVLGNNAYGSDETSKAEIIAINKRVYQLFTDNDHESAFAHIYWTCRQWSYDGFEALYTRLGVHPFERYLPESETTPIGVAIAERALAEGVLEKSGDAVIYKGEDHGLHTRVFINSEGIPTYETKDLGLAATKWRDYKFDKNIIITANDIVEYMKVVISVLAHFYPEVAERTVHLTHGLIKLPGGVKMSSRLGNALMANDVLEAAFTAGRALRSSADTDEQVIIGAIKYSFLKQKIGADIVYDPADSVSLEGNSGPYLQYAHARAKSILSKVTTTSQQATTYEPAERLLALKLTEYETTLQHAVAEMLPHYICTYLYELTQAFNRFYEQSRVVGDPREAERGALVKRYAATLQHGLNLLGIIAPDAL